ncbi:hypothetical protein, partial [Corynebacterium striatum]|uniref:hypothetical protein n=1 Tax=Corynebacterium striatum TaxID=43770 RepID=UPI0027B9DF80
TQNTKNIRNYTSQTTTHKASLFGDARVHYTVLTQHPNHQQQPRLKQTMTVSMTGQHQDNNAPDTQQCTNIQPLCNNPTV